MAEIEDGVLCSQVSTQSSTSTSFSVARFFDELSMPFTVNAVIRDTGRLSTLGRWGGPVSLPDFVTEFSIDVIYCCSISSQSSASASFTLAGWQAGSWDCWSAGLCGLPCSTAIHESAAATGRAGGAADPRVSPTASAGPRVPLPHVPRACPRKAPQGRPVSCPSPCRPDGSLLTVRIARLAKSVGGVVRATHNLLGTIRASNLYKCSVAVCMPQAIYATVTEA